MTSRLGVEKLHGYFRRVLLSGRSAPDPTLRAAARSAIKAVRTAARTFHVSRPSRWRIDASYAWLDGKPARARQLWRKSLAEAERLAMPYEQGLAHYEIGRHAAGAERQTHLIAAEAIFTQLGAAYDLARVQEALERR